MLFLLEYESTSGKATNLLRHFKWMLPGMPVHAQSFVGIELASSQE